MFSYAILSLRSCFSFSVDRRRTGKNDYFSNVATSAEFGRTDLRQLIFAIVKSDDFAIPETSF